MKRIFGVVLAMVIMMQTMAFIMPLTANAETYTNQSRELMTRGNKIVYKDDPKAVIRLTGMNVPGGEWTGTPSVEKLERSVKEAIFRWNANLIRLPVSVEGWYGTYNYVNDGGRGYRNYMDNIISIVAAEGRYVVLDLHHYKSFNKQQYLDFWKEAAEKYGNNPAVLFGILNEPHSTTWEVWRNGDGGNITGHQQVVEMIRDLGARNIIVAGGLDYAYRIDDCFEQGYGLIDQGSNNNKSKTGNGIMYDTHIYPWKGHANNWDKAIGDVRKEYPILVGESGWDPATNLEVGKKEYKPGSDMYHDKWMPELFAWMNDEETYGNLANWTGWCFHPNSAPRILADKDRFKYDDYDYPPTDFCGVYVKEQLEKDLGKNIVSLATVTADSDIGYTADSLTDGDGSTVWRNSAAGDKEITFAFDGMAVINRWRIKSLEAAGGEKADNVNSFRVEASLNGTDWDVLETVTGNQGGYLERQIRPTKAKYLRFVITKGNAVDNTANICDIDIFSNQEILQMGGNKPFTDGSGGVDEARLTTYLSQDFEGATVKDGVVHVQNKATGADLPWTILGDGICAIHSGDGKSSGAFLQGSGEKNAGISLTLPTEIAKQEKLIHFDARIKRGTFTGGDVSLKVKDKEDNELFELQYPEKSIPVLTGDREYGMVTPNSIMTEIAYPYTEDWMYVRTIFNQQLNVFEMYVGETRDEMQCILRESASFGYKNTDAAGISKIEFDLGTISLDDIEIYTVDTSAVKDSDFIHGNIGNGVVSEQYVDLDFEGAVMTDEAVPGIKVKNQATGQQMQWINDTDLTSGFYTVKEDGGNKYIGGVRKGKVPVKLELDRAVNGDGNLVYCDVKIKRESLVDEEVSFILRDENGREIIELFYPRYGGTPQIYGDRVYGNGMEDTSISYPATDEWIYVRMMIDFAEKEIFLYQGTDVNQLTAMDKTTEAVGFKDGGAVNLKEVYMGDKGALNIDDLRICAGVPYDTDWTAALKIKGMMYGANAQATVQVCKQFDETVEGTLYVVLYQGNTAVYAKKQEISVSGGKGIEEIPVKLGNVPQGNYRVKVFLWNDEIQPLAKAAVY